jgi:hypothetical protein
MQLTQKQKDNKTANQPEHRKLMSSVVLAFLYFGSNICIFMNISMIKGLKESF